MPTREDQRTGETRFVAIASLIVAAVACIAAVLVVPEVRGLLGLDHDVGREPRTMSVFEATKPPTTVQPAGEVQTSETPPAQPTKAQPLPPKTPVAETTNIPAQAKHAVITSTPSSPVAPANMPTTSSTPTKLCLIDDAFQTIWVERQDELGCSRGPVQLTTVTVEAFEGGFLVWIKASDRIYVLRNGSSWSTYPNTWTSGEDDLPCDAARSYGYPAMGFGELWCTDHEVYESLGPPLNREIPRDGAKWQPFDNGETFQAPAGEIFIVYDDQTWEIVPSAEGAIPTQGM